VGKRPTQGIQKIKYSFWFQKLNKACTLVLYSTTHLPRAVTTFNFQIGMTHTMHMSDLWPEGPALIVKRKAEYKVKGMTLGEDELVAAHAIPLPTLPSSSVDGGNTAFQSLDSESKQWVHSSPHFLLSDHSHLCHVADHSAIPKSLHRWPRAEWWDPMGSCKSYPKA
jgi:hypothetical protein